MTARKSIKPPAVKKRGAEVERETRETAVRVTLDLDGTGRANIATGVPFLDHMLAQVAAHGLIDLDLAARGDLDVDAHHTVEDVAIVLGLALDRALGERQGIARMGDSFVPMDDALALVALLWLALSRAQRAQAVTPYEVTTCTAQGLVDAMNTFNNTPVQDGIISFNCGTTHAPATISISYPGGYGVATNAAYTIDGGGVITLSGGNANRVLNVQANAALTLTNLSVIDGNAGADYGGCIFNFSGKLRLDNVTLQNCRTADSYLGGAIYTSGGWLTVSGSRILSSTSSHGGGIFSGGTLVIVNSRIADNRATAGDGGGLNVTGNASISGSQIERNQASGGDGGGLYAASASNLTIQNSLLASNVTTVTTFASGGGLYSLGSLMVTNSILSANLARYGGGLDSEGAALLNNATLSGNRATTTGGGIINAGYTTVSNSTLNGNSADFSGGGIDNNAGTLTLFNTLIANTNRPREPARAWRGSKG